MATVITRDASSKFNDLLTWIYFIQTDDQLAHIKIGQSGNLRSRFENMKVACPAPLKLIGAIRAYDCAEIALHRLFADESIRGEWFRSSTRLLKFINRVNTDFGGRRVPTAILVEWMRDANLEGSAQMEPWYQRMLRNSRSEGGAKPASGYRPSDFKFLSSLRLVSPRRAIE